MAEIVLTVDASQAKQALNSVNQAITQAKINGATIKLDGKDVTSQLGKMKDAAKKAGEAVGKTTTEQAKNASKSLKGLTSMFKQALGQIRGFLNGTLSWWTALIVAVELATKTMKYFWDNLTQSTQKMTTRGQNAIKVAQLNKKKVQQETNASKALISKLEELNKQQNLTASEQKLADSIVAKLNKQYKDLGITLDQTTGKYQGLYQAQIKIDEKNKNVQVDAIKKQITAQRDVINAALKNAGLQINIGQMINGKELFTIAEHIGKTLGAQNADILARKWNTGDIVKQLEVIDQLLNGLSSGDQFMQNGTAVRDAMQTLVDYKDQLKNLLSVDTQIIDANTRLANSFKKFEDAIKQSEQNVKDYEKQLQKLVDQNNYDQASLPEKIGLKQSQIDRVDKEIEDNIKRLDQLKKQLAETQVYDDTGEAFNQQQRRYNELKDKTSKLEEDYNSKRLAYEEQRNKKLAKLQREREKLAAGNQTLPGATLGPTVNGNKNEIAKIDKQIADIDKNDQYKELNKAYKELTKSQQKLSSQEAKYQAERQNQLKLSQQIAQLEEDIAKGRLTREQASIEAEKLREQYRQEQLEAERKLKEQEDKRNQDYSDFVNGLMKKQVDGLNQIIDKKKESLLLELQLNAEKIRGRKLTEEELEALKSYVDVMSMQDQLKAGQKLDLQTNGVITNDLARKGGWASSVVVDRAQDINKDILNVEKTQVDLMNKLNETMNRSNELLKQFSVIQ